MKKVLLMTYKFPPMGGVATRRWVKLCKELSQRGHEIHVLTSSYPYHDEVSWSKELPDCIHIHRYDSMFPSWILKKHDSKIGKITSRILNFLLKKVFFYLDEAQFDTKNLVSRAKAIIEQHDIDNVIASGHPVSFNYAASILKFDIPSINLIQDFRDNWNDLSNYSYPKGLKSLKRKQNSINKEIHSVNYSDHVINVTEDLSRVMRERHSFLPKEKFSTVYNFYDVEDFSALNGSDVFDEFSIVYLGSLYNNRFEAIALILDALAELNDGFLLEKIKIKLYTNFPTERVPNKYNGFLGKNLFIYPFVAPEMVSNIVRDSFSCLSINSRGAEYAFGTKIFDYMALNKNIIHVSNGGELYNIMESSGQLVCNYDVETMKSTLILLKDDYLKKGSNFQSPTENMYQEYSLIEAASKIERLLV